jgi:hypothetical protein
MMLEFVNDIVLLLLLANVVTFIGYITDGKNVHWSFIGTVPLLLLAMLRRESNTAILALTKQSQFNLILMKDLNGI